MFIVTSALKARPSSFRSGTEWPLYPTAHQWRGRQRYAMPLRWSLADPVASVAINMALQKELFAASRLPRRRVNDTYKEQIAPSERICGYLRAQDRILLGVILPCKSGPSVYRFLATTRPASH